MSTELDPREASHHRGLLEQAIAQALPYPDGQFSGRGIVLCAGGARMLTGAWVTIGVLRRVIGCDLPIELWHIGPGELGTDIKAILEEADAKVVDALEVSERHPMRMLGGWELKPYAVMHSRFREVLLLDADNVPTSDPAFLFETEGYRETGALFWPDVVRLAQDNAVWELLGVTYADEWSVESGQLVVDKERAWDALQVCVHMNAHSDFFYRFVYGDKDTFYLAWRRTGTPYTMIARPPKRTSYGVIQHDLDGRPLFQHRMNAKWMLRGANHALDGFVHANECLELLEELQAMWDGRIFHPPARSIADLELERRLVDARSFLYRRVSSDERVIELLPSNRIGAGRDTHEQRWYVADGYVVFEGEGRLTCRLRDAGDGTWQGTWEIGDRADVELVPLTPVAGTSAAPSGSADIIRALIDRFAEGSRSEADTAAIQTTLTTLREVLPDLRSIIEMLVATSYRDDPDVRKLCERIPADERRPLGGSRSRAYADGKWIENYAEGR